MKTISKKLAAFAAAAAMLLCAGCSANGNTTDPADAANTSDVTEAQTQAEAKVAEWNELDQTAITEAMGMGWNLGNQLEASNSGVPSETAWGNPVITETLIKAVKEQGFKTVRIPVSYLLKIGEAPDYKIDGDWLNRIQEVVDYVVNNDLYAVVNMHGDGYYTVDKGWLLCVEDDEKQVEIKAKYATNIV